MLRRRALMAMALAAAFGLASGSSQALAQPKELVIFAVVMSTACALLFKYALSLPIPLAPWLLGI